MSSPIENSNTVSALHPLWLFCYSLFCYLLSVSALVYFIVFTSGIYTPLSVNNQNSDQPFALALLANITLIMLFGLQHSIMARRSFKQWLLRYIPQSVERATYCLASALALCAVGYFWIPMTGEVWNIASESLALAVQCLGGMGWVILLVATFQLDHFELFGLRQTFAPLTGQVLPDPYFKTPGLYKIVRHPIQLGVLIGLWAVPTSTINHLVLAVAMTIYVFIGLYFEEEDLIQEFGSTYNDYKKCVAKVIPFLG